MSLFDKGNLTSVEYIFKRTLVHFGMKKLAPEKVEKIVKGGAAEGENE